MILSKEFYDRCCPTYRKIIDELEKKLADLNDQEEIRAAILEFSRSYLTPKEYWVICFVFTGDLESYRLNQTKWENLYREAAEQAYCHFHYDKGWNYLRFPDQFVHMHLYNRNYLKLIDNEYCQDSVSEQSIGYPHSDLKNYFRRFEATTCKPLSKSLINRYEAMKELYPKIKAAEENVYDWFNLLLEAVDISFLKDNVEYRLGKDYFDLQLWKLYIGFLKKHGEYKLLLSIYSKYCRFFLDDHQMLEEYKEYMVQYDPACLSWNTLFDYEVTLKEAEEQSLQVEEILPLDENLCVTFYDTLQVQNFSLPRPLILYILKNANHLVLRKLFSSCKYFFAKHSTPICYGLDTESEIIFNGEDISLYNGANQDLFVRNTYVTGFIFVGFELEDNDFISNLISRMYRCEAKSITLCYQNLSFNELKFLIQHGGVVYLDLVSCHLLDEIDEFVDLEEIMKYLPNIESLDLMDIKVNANTAHALSQLTFNVKFNYFYILGIYGDPFDAYEFLKYCEANKVDGYFTVGLVFDGDFDAEFVDQFSKIMDDYKKSYKNSCVSISTS